MSIDSLWNIIKAKYQSPGQYADNDLMMATVIALNLDIQHHGGSNLLLNVEGQITRNTIHLLYCGLQINNNRGNHYDTLLPIISSTNNPPIVNVAANTQTSVSGDTKIISCLPKVLWFLIMTLSLCLLKTLRRCFQSN